MNKIVILVIGIVFGSVLGGSISYYITISSVRTFSELLAKNYATWEAEGAYYQYKAGSLDLAEHSFRHLLEIYDGIAEITNNDTALADTGFTYIRLGEIADQLGKHQQAQEYYQLGLDSYQEYCRLVGIKREYTIESLRQLIQKVDSQEQAKKPQVFKSLFSNV